MSNEERILQQVLDSLNKILKAIDDMQVTVENGFAEIADAVKKG